MLRVGLVRDAIEPLVDGGVVELAHDRFFVDRLDQARQLVEVLVVLVQAVALLAQVGVGTAVAVRRLQDSRDRGAIAVVVATLALRHARGDFGVAVGLSGHGVPPRWCC